MNSKTSWWAVPVGGVSVIEGTHTWGLRQVGPRIKKNAFKKYCSFMRKASTLGRGKPTTKSGIHAIRTLQCAYVSSLYSGLALQCILQTRVDRDTLACQHTAVSYEPPKATFFQGDFGSLALDVLDVLSHPQEIATDDTNLLIIFVISFWRITIVGNFQIPQTESDTHRKEKNSCI